MSYEWVSEALVSDHPLLFHHAVAYETSFFLAISPSYDHFFRISEVIAYESFDCSHRAQKPRVG